MSNKTDLQALNANYEALIEELRGKAVGGGTGGGVETCTVTLIDSSENTLSNQGFYIGLEVEPNSGRSTMIVNSAEVLLEGCSMVKNSLLVLYDNRGFAFCGVDIDALILNPSSYLVGAEIPWYDPQLTQNFGFLFFHLTGDEVIINLPWL